MKIKELNELVALSNNYGSNPELVIAGGGNTSYKTDDILWVKAGGTELRSITENGFVSLERIMLQQIMKNSYSEDSVEREQQVTYDLLRAKVNPELQKYPSMEALVHELLPFSFVVHTHPTYVNALMCSRNAEKAARELFGNDALFISYCAPGYVLAKKVEADLMKCKQSNTKIPQIILLENHGVILAANTTKEIDDINNRVLTTIKSKLPQQPDQRSLPIDKETIELLPTVRMLLSDDSLKIARVRKNNMILHFCSGNEAFQKINGAFTPDHIVYCKSRPLFLDRTGNSESLTQLFMVKLEQFVKENGYQPKVILIKDYGMIGVAENSHNADTVLDVFEDAMKISFYASAFGGPRFIAKDEVDFIESWDAEKYHKNMHKGTSPLSAFSQRIAIVTGGAQGFGAGIVEEMMKDGFNLVIADLNSEKAEELCKKLNGYGWKNKVVFVKTDVSDTHSVENLINQTVIHFGGLDIFISNAGILKAGSVEEMTPETFELMTKINYSAFFYCVKYASRIMKLQAGVKSSHFMDIIQINSKSGLRGSNKNFAYAGSKFGSIGLVQSFALELIAFNIKVNAICPGNFFEGPLWADPETGLFVQYLKAGKVKGAKTIDDVKKHYENQVPAGRGCRVADVIKAIYYIIGQEYETGQALPVTGGQVMLN